MIPSSKSESMWKFADTMASLTNGRVTDVRACIRADTCAFCLYPVDPTLLSEIDAREFTISGMCPECHKDLFD